MSVWSDQAAGFLDISESSSHFLKNRHTEKARCKTCKTTLENGEFRNLPLHGLAAAPIKCL